MALRLWIPNDMQYGELEPGEARQSVFRQTAQQALMHRLFAQTDDDPGEELFCRLEHFTQALHERLPTNPKVKALWLKLMVDIDTPKVTEMKGAAVQTSLPEMVGDAFCYAWHGVCAALVTSWMKYGEQGLIDAEEQALQAQDALQDGGTSIQEEPEAKDDDAGCSPVNPVRAERSVVLGYIGLHVHKALLHHLGNDETVPVSSEINRLFAAIWLDALLVTCSDWLAEVDGGTHKRNGQPHTYQWIVLQQPRLIRSLKALLGDLPWRFTLQPLRQPVAYQVDVKALGNTPGQDGFAVPLFGYRRSNQFLRDFHVQYQQSSAGQEAIRPYLSAINTQQNVAWRINRPLLTVARSLCEAIDASLVTLQNPVFTWACQNFYPDPKKKQSGKRRSMLPGEMLDNPLAARALHDLCPENGEQPAFYLPWKADYRGRMYAHTPWFTPQGGDFPRALLEFAESKPLSEQGLTALRRHGANLVKRQQLLDDLNIKDRQVVTLAEREQWIIEHEQAILDCATAPLAQPFWCQVAGKPWQFLVFCLAYRQWHDNPEALLHLPVQIDGTCNGLQHIAALTGDEALAKAVNVLPGNSDFPEDIYSTLAQAAITELEKIDCTRKSGAIDSGLVLAKQWLLANEPKNWMHRATAKRVVMTIPYGACETAQAGFVAEEIAEQFAKIWPISTTTDQLLALQGLSKINPELLKACPNTLFAAYWANVNEQKKANPDVVTLLKNEIMDMRKLLAHVALLIVKALRAALAKHYPVVDQFSDWLLGMAASCRGFPLLWLSPVGVPVCQDKFTLQGTQLQAGQGKHQVRLDFKKMTEQAWSHAQSRSLLPNFIHSLDAAHLAMTLLAASKQHIHQVGSIHDCLLCHPNDTEVLGLVVRQCFVKLYGQDATRSQGVGVLLDWFEWMRLVSAIQQTGQVNVLLGALQAPGGLGEQCLDENNRLLLQSLRQFGPVHCQFAVQLLKYRQQVALTPTEDPLPSLPFTHGLPIEDAHDLSVYFFS